MKFRQWAIIGALLVLVLAAGAGFLATREAGLPAKTLRNAQAPLVDQRPLQTARRLAGLAVTPEEQRLAQTAARLGDHAVDLAFEDALLEASEHPAETDPKNRALYARLQKIQATLTEEQAHLDQLKKRLASAQAGDTDALQEQIALLQAQADLDEDDLEDAREDLVRAGGDPQGKIERLRAEHEASEHGESAPASEKPGATVDLGATNLLQQVRAWNFLRAKSAALEAGRQEAAGAARTLAAEHESLERHVNEEAEEREDARRQATGKPARPEADAKKSKSSRETLSSLKRYANDQRQLSDYDKRIQDEQDLAGTYGSWIGMVAGEQRTALHGMLASTLWILLIVFFLFLASGLINQFFSGVAPEKKRLFTLRAVMRFGLQAVGVLLIAFVIFGAPNQTPTVLGLAGAGLTVALKDFIVAFFGWFVLMGRNGIRVGDWVEINGVVGEVIEIGLLRTVLLETGNWTDTGHPTGRKVAFVNSFAIEGHFFNFSTAGQWLWDELQVLIPPGENPYPLVESIQRLVEEETRASASRAEQEWQKSAGKRMQSLSVAPAIHLRPTVMGVEMQIRYITSANERYVTRSRMYEKIVGLLHGQAKAQGPAVPVQRT